MSVLFGLIIIPISLVAVGYCLYPLSKKFTFKIERKVNHQ